MGPGTVLRRALAHRGLLLLVVLLVTVVAAAGGTTAGSVTSSTVRAAQEALTEPEPAALEVTTRVAEDPDAQDDRVRETVAGLFAGTPVLVERTETPDDGDTPFVRWTLRPDVGTVTPADLGVLASGGEALHEELRSDDAVAVRGLTTDGDLAVRAADADRTIATARAVATVPGAILALVALVALAQVARLLTGARHQEVEILVARGAAPRQLVAGAVGESAVVGVVGAVVGSVVAAAIVGDAGAAGLPVTTVLATGTTTAVVATAVLTAAAGLQARALARRRAADRSGRLRQAATVGGVLGVGVLAVLGMVRWRSLGSPVVVTDDGVAADPLAVLGPALLLATAGMVALALLGPVTRAWSALAARSPRATGVLAARQVSRGLRVVAVPMVLLVLCGGTAVLAAAYVATTDEARGALTAQQVGTDVRVTLPDRGRLSAARPAPTVNAFAALDGAEAAAPVLVDEATVDGDPLQVTAVPVALAPDVLTSTDPEQLESLLAPLGPGPDLTRAPAMGEGVTGLTLTVAGRAALNPDAFGPDGIAGFPAELVDDVSVSVAAWLAADDGTVAVLDAGTVALGPDTVREQLAVDVPAGLAAAPGLRLIALDVAPGAVDLPTDTTFRVLDVTASTESGDRAVDVAGVAWDPARPGSGAAGEPAQDAGALELAATLDPGGAEAVRFLAASGSAGTDAAAEDTVPVTLTESAAGRWDAGPGDVLEATVAGSSVRLQVGAVVPRIPGTTADDAALVDLGTLDATLLRTSTLLPRPADVWIAAQDRQDADAVTRLATGAGAEARAQAPDPQDASVTSITATTGADTGGPVRLAALTAAVGAAVLAVVGLAVAAVVGLAARRRETVVLRATGVGARSQGAGRALEVAVVGAAGLVAGVLAGVAVAALTVPGLAVGVVGSATSPDLTIDPRLLTVLLAAGAAGVAATAAVVGTRVAAQVRDTEYRPEVR